MKNIVWHHIRTGIISIMMIVSFYSYASPPTYNNISIYNNNGKALIYNRAGYPEYVTFLPESQIDSAFFYANTSLVPVIFKVNKYDLQNAQPIDSIITTINKIMSEPEVHLAYIWIGGSASPEGPPTWNKKLGHYRSQALAQYLRSTTELPDSIFRIENLEEDWYSFTVALRTKDTFPHRDEILHIIASEPDTEKRKLQIKAIDGGRTWSRGTHGHRMLRHPAAAHRYATTHSSALLPSNPTCLGATSLHGNSSKKMGVCNKKQLAFYRHTHCQLGF